MSAYIPNGKSVEHDDYQFKLEWLRRLRAYLDRGDAAQPVALGGDFNVAMDERDIHDPVAWEGENLCSEPERAEMANVLDWGLADTFRDKVPDAGFYSWWDYRMLGFPKNRGLRIDYVFVTDALRGRLTNAFIDRNARKGTKPSDHAPVVAEFSE